MDDDAIKRRIKKLAHARVRSATGSAVQIQHRHTLRIAGLFPVHGVNIVQTHLATGIRFDGRVELTAQLGEISHGTRPNAH